MNMISLVHHDCISPYFEASCIGPQRAPQICDGPSVVVQEYWIPSIYGTGSGLLTQKSRQQLSMYLELAKNNRLSSNFLREKMNIFGWLLEMTKLSRQITSDGGGICPKPTPEYGPSTRKPILSMTFCILVSV